MRIREILREVDHNPSVVKIDYDTLQTLIVLGIGQGTWGFGYADVNNYVALIGSVGHGIGRDMGIRNVQQQQAPDSDVNVTITAKDYGDDSDRIAGTYRPDTGEIAINRELVDALKPGVDRVLGAQRASTIVHEMMHRGFSVIRNTPELVKVMPKDIQGYWLNDWGDLAGDNYLGNLQASAEHAMIYTHELGPERFRWPFEDKFPFRRLVEIARNPRTRSSIEDLAGNGYNIIYCRIDSVVDRNSPIYGMRPLQIYRYWREQFDLVNQGLQTFFARSGPPRRLTRGGFERDREERDRERERRERDSKRRELNTIDLKPLEQTALGLMDQTNITKDSVEQQIGLAVDKLFADTVVSASWRSIVTESITDFVINSNRAGLHVFMRRLKRSLITAAL